MRILFYGDSNTWGYDAPTGTRMDNRYTRLLMKELDDEIIEEGLNGRTIAFDDPFDSTRNGLKAIRTVLKTHMPIDIIFINLGVNDTKRVFNANEYTIEKGMRALINEIRGTDYILSGGKEPKIVLVQPARIHPDAMKDHEFEVCFGQTAIDIMDTALDHLKVIANQYNVEVLETPNLYASNYDGIHMDEKGHALMATYIKEKLEEYR